MRARLDVRKFPASNSKPMLSRAKFRSASRFDRSNSKFGSSKFISSKSNLNVSASVPVGCAESGRICVHATMIHQWKKALLDGAADIFERGGRRSPEVDEDTVRALHAKIL